MKRTALLFAFLLLISALLPGCQNPDSGKESAGEQETPKIEIGMSFDSFVIERWQRDRDIFVSAAKELGAEVNVQNANGDIARQKEQIAYFIKKGVDVIVVVAIDSDALKDEITRAKNAGIKVIAYDRLVKNVNVDLYISFDNVKVGRMMADALVRNRKGDGPVLMLGGSLADHNVSLVESGFHSVLEENGIEDGPSMHCDGWLAELAEEFIYQNEDLVAMASGIMCGNDNIAGHVLRVLSENRLAGEIPVVGQDADLEACQRIVEGTQLMTVYKPVELLAERTAACAIALAKGEKIEGEDVATIDDGTYEVPYIGLEPVAVTKENLDEVIIGSGFHLKEDVYLYQPEQE